MTRAALPDHRAALTATDDVPGQVFACVWDALMDSPGEAVAMRLRSDLLRAIQQTVAGWNMTQATAARRLDVTRPRLDDLVCGRISTFSFDGLIQLATQAGLEVRLQVQPAVG